MGEGILKDILDFVRGHAQVSARDVAEGCGLAVEDAGAGLATLVWRGVLRAHDGDCFGPMRPASLPGRSYVSAISHPNAARLMGAR
jgi:hypothetical protein